MEKRTPISLYLADHTWVTSYDLRVENYSNINEVITAKEHYWYSKGDFHSHGDFIGRINYHSPNANCLVTSNDKINGNGTIKYGVHGVCHQISNQVIYRSKYQFNNLRVEKARGYKLSSSIYGTYGLNHVQWKDNKVNCFHKSFRIYNNSLLTTRAKYFTKNTVDISIMKYLESERLRLLEILAEEGNAKKKLNESTSQRVEKMNQFINNFTTDVSNLIEEDLYQYIFGIDKGTRIDIIDAEQFEFIK